MPLIKRDIQPVNLSRGSVAPGIQNELECVTNNTLANVIHQLSSLSRHAEDMFGELFKEANSFFQRASHLQERVDRLKVKVTQLDSTIEEVSLQDINMRKPFHSAALTDQQVVSRSSMPRAMLETYNQCDKPPPLEKLNAYREDGKDSMKFYTDPTYFFELWFQEMQKDTEQKKTEYQQRKKKRRPKQQLHEKQRPREIRSRADKYQNMKAGQEFMEKTTIHRPNSLEIKQQQQQRHHSSSGQNYQQDSYHGYDQHIRNSSVSNHIPNHVPQYNNPPPYNRNESSNIYDTRENRDYQMNRSSSVLSPRPSQPPPAPPEMVSSPARMRSMHSGSRNELPPPPPPPPVLEDPQHGYAPSPDTHHYPKHIHESPRNSPSRQSPYSGGTPDSMDLPPPPPPPISPNNITSMPPPPLTPPPPELAEPFSQHNGMIPPPPPPPPPPGGDGMMMNDDDGSLAPPANMADNSSVSSAGSSLLASKVEKSNPVVDERSDLLQAIRQGIQLRKVEERQHREEQKRQHHNTLDVQSIMDKAFEMRRKALEASDSEDDDDWDGDGNWDDDDDGY